jgi:hypothetical protein
MEGTRVLFEWHRDWRDAGARAGFSLHSHTCFSREPLDFIPRCVEACPWIEPFLRRYEARYRRACGRSLDYAGAWWTPPLGPREALRVEREQIGGLGLRAEVSITDHDSIEAPLRLRLLSEGRDTPLSTEWTVPWKGAVFHLGIHNLPPDRAGALFSLMADYTAQPHAAAVGDILRELAAEPSVLVVFNHPFWDEKGAGANYHAVMAEQFLVRYKPWIHALELNGLRPWKENCRTMGLASRYGLPCVSGGDRHGCEPNALINLSDAENFGEFVREIREKRTSCVLVMKQYREPMALRILSAIGDVMRDQTEHSHGWVKWSDRVFYRTAEGEAAPLSSVFAGGKEPSLIRLFVWLSRFAGHEGVRFALRRLLPEAEEVA